MTQLSCIRLALSPKDDVVIASVKTALEQAIAQLIPRRYENEAAVGGRLKKAAYRVTGLFITTKIWIENLSKDKLIPSLKRRAWEEAAY